MECQSHLKLVKNTKPRKYADLGCTDSNLTSDLSPSSAGASVEQPPLSLPQASLPSHLEQNLTQVILTSPGLQAALFGLAQIMGEAFSADCCLIVSQQPAAIQVNPLATSHITCWYPDSVIPFTPSPHDFLSLLRHPAIQSGLEDASEPLAIFDLPVVVQQRDASAGEPIKKKVAASRNLPQVRAILIERTQFQGQVNGLIILMRSQPYHWKESDVQLLKTLSPQVAIALSQTHLEQQVHQQVRYQNVINQLTTAIRNSWDLNRTFQLAVEGAGTALQASRGLILLFKYNDPLHRTRPSTGVPKAKVRVTAEWGQSPQWVPEGTTGLAELGGDRTFWASDCKLCQQVLAGNGELVLIPASAPAPLSQPSEVEGTVSPILDLKAFPSVLLVPLENQGTILGCLVIQHHQQRLWASEEVSFVKLAAAQLSTAIIQSRTIQQIQAVVQERTAQLQRSLEVQAKLYEKSRQQVEQLRRLNEEREEFLSTVSHELRTPLTSMTLAIRMLRQAELSPERQARYLDILEQQCVQETQLINDLLALRKLEASQTTTQLQKLDLRYLIRDIAQSVEESFLDKELQLQLNLPDQPLTLYTESDSFSRILTELLTNAKKYSIPGSIVQLEAQLHEPGSNQITLKLQNIGAGILPEELPHIFDKFRRGKGVTKQAIQGTGLGLALVKGLVEHLGGAIDASSQPQEHETSWQTCFKVTFPQCPEEMMSVISGRG